MYYSISILKVRNSLIQTKKYMGFINNRSPYWLKCIGNREMVGFGMNGLPMYTDRPDYPFPSLRYKEITSELQGLFEKQKGKWHELTKDEKKELYRANYCQTFAEFMAPTGDWLEISGYALILSSLGIWLFILYYIFVAPPKPASFHPSNVRAQMRRMIDMQINPIQGIASKWDYEKNDWKVKRWNTPPNPFVKCPDDL